MENIKFRKAVIEDLETLYKFEQGIISAERPFDPTLKEGHINYYDLKAIIQNEDSEVFVCFHNDNIVASASIRIKEADPFLKHEKYAFLGFMFVRNDYRGKGINKGIIEKLHAWAKDRNLNEVRLKVYQDNEPAIKAYEKAGFKRHLIEMRLDLNQVK